MPTEHDKHRKNNYEDKRLTIFLMGLIFVLACCLVALEHNDYDAYAHSDDEDILREMMAETNAMPMMTHTETIVEPAPEAQNDGEGQIRIVADEEEVAEDDEKTEIDDTLPGDSIMAGIDSMAAEGMKIAPPPPIEQEIEDNPLHFRVVEDMPQFPGGQAALVKYLTQHLRYPDTARRMNVQGKVAVTFIVEADGSLTDFDVAVPLHPACNNEALRVLRMMPKWTPGKQHGKPCRTMVCVPIVFKM